MMPRERITRSRAAKSNNENGKGKNSKKESKEQVMS